VSLRAAFRTYRRGKVSIIFNISPFAGVNFRLKEQDYVQKALSLLNGEKLRCVNRAGAMADMGFGEDVEEIKPDETKKVSWFLQLYKHRSM
jgi:hypothetical protein